MFSYIDPKYLANLRKYHYVGVDNSILTKYLLDYIWQFLVSLCPMSLAPNAMTLIGMSFNLLSWAFIFFGGESLSEGSKWPFLWYAISTWCYQALDAIDGKQARRTNTSSPLGELFDHGCDSLNCLMTVFIVKAVFGLPLDKTFYYLTALQGMTIFYLSTVEEYFTGVLYLGYISGPTDGSIGLILCSLINFLKGGNEMWRDPVIRIYIPWLGSLDGRRLFILLTTLMGIASFIGTVRNLSKAGKLSAAAISLGPFIFFCGVCAGWLEFINSLKTFKPILIKWSIMLHGMTFVGMVGRVILAHLLNAPFPSLSLPNAVHACFVIASLLVPIQMCLRVIQFGVLALTIFHIHFVLSVINTFCSFLNISCLTIKQPRKNRLRGVKAQ